MNAKDSTGIKDKITGLLGNPKSRNIIIIVGIVGMLLILLSEYLPKGSGASPTTAKADAVDSQEYAKQLEGSLTEIIGSISGVGQAKVMVTLENGVEYIYATDQSVDIDQSEDTTTEGKARTDQRSNTENKLILVDSSDGAKQALVKTEISPKVKGVVIVCEGGEDPIVKERLIGVVTTALDITYKRVCVTLLSN